MQRCSASLLCSDSLFLGRELPLLRGSNVTGSGNSLCLALNGLRVPLAGDVEEDELEGVEKGAAALIDGEETDRTERAEDPDDANCDPAGEEGLGENVAAAVHGHRPKNEEGKAVRVQC